MTDNSSLSNTTPRRGFLARLAAASLGLAGFTAAPELFAQRASPAEGRSEDDWMAALTAKHRTVLDVAAHRNGKPLTQAKNYLDAWRGAFHTSEHDINLVVGVHGEGIPIVLSDALWARYELGRQYEAVDPSTKAPAVRNVFAVQGTQPEGLVTPEQTVQALQRRGVRFLVCMNTIASATKKLADAGLGAPADIRAALLGGLLPGVITVPAMVVALTQLQERGLSYTKLA
jgi:intracellular sulfur oxidation DsrE/DsrF family protein